MQKLEGGDPHHPGHSPSSLPPSLLPSQGSVCTPVPAIWLVFKWVVVCLLQDAETHIQRDFVTILARALDCRQKKQAGCFRQERDLFQRYGELTESPGGPENRV